MNEESSLSAMSPERDEARNAREETLGLVSAFVSIGLCSSSELISASTIKFEDLETYRREMLEQFSRSLRIPVEELAKPVSYEPSRSLFWQRERARIEREVFELLAGDDPRRQASRRKATDDARKLRELAELYEPRRGTLFSSLRNPRRGRPRRN